MNIVQPFFIGCAIWAYKDWIGDLFPTGSKSADLLRLYSRRLTTVEGNTTFYATPKPEVVARWAAETPEEFRFCFKLPREVSHSGPLVPQLPATHAFVERLAPLGARLGPFFLQLPPGYGPQRYDDLARWLAAWPSSSASASKCATRLVCARGEAQLMALLEQHNAGRVVMDVRPIREEGQDGAELLDDARERKPDVPLRPIYSSDFTLIRYIGNPDYTVNEPFLDEWAARIAQWLHDGVTVYAFMHCPDEARSPALCRALYQRLAALTTLPPLPWDEADGGSVEQTSMFG
ncbi:DUF72 domain-containing protein [Candidatus Gracilibacteria bacterium]|nr:DUF72 domain-containing protein [Candidatus Gracilibacteria bacterium]